MKFVKIVNKVPRPKIIINVYFKNNLFFINIFISSFKLYISGFYIFYYDKNGVLSLNKNIDKNKFNIHIDI